MHVSWHIYNGACKLYLLLWTFGGPRTSSLSMLCSILEATCCTFLSCAPGLVHTMKVCEYLEVCTMAAQSCGRIKCIGYVFLPFLIFGFLYFSPSDVCYRDFRSHRTVVTDFPVHCLYFAGLILLKIPMFIHPLLLVFSRIPDSVLILKLLLQMLQPILSGLLCAVMGYVTSHPRVLA